MITNKEKILNYLKDLSREDISEDKKLVSASEVADKLLIKRNVVSLHLNDLCREGIVKKTNSRPVYFRYEDNIDTLKEGKDIFEELIGSSGSLKRQVEQCKMAASYPGKGLPVILTGESGVGKSYMAQLIYEYAKQNGHIEKNAPFVIFNCAEYANNPELLSAKLFGYQKGAFTGANSDMPGLIEEANHGYLFLDEVHRLTPEGQEKLFLILDKGIYKRLGDSGKTRNASIRFIFATTEDTEGVLLETFLRRIPLHIKISNFSERPINEKLSFIYKFYYREAKKIGLNIEVSKQILNLLISMKLSGNIGRLINIIKYSCAHAYKSQDKNKSMMVKLKDIPYEALSYERNDKKYDFGDMLVDLENEDFSHEDVLKNHNEINTMILELTDIAEDFIVEKSMEDALRKSNVVLNKITDEIIFNKEEYDFDIFSVDILQRSVNDALKIMEERYAIKYYGNSANVLTRVLGYFYYNIAEFSKKSKKNLQRTADILKKHFPRYYLIANKFLNLVEVSIDYKFDYRAIIYLVYYFCSINEKNDPDINAIIIAHGYSTASSIASVANKLIGEFIFEAFDMAIEVSPEEVEKKIKKHIETIDRTKGLIILVDMGSLEDMYKSLTDIVRNDIVIINNITTQIALDVGFKISQGVTLRDIADEAHKWNKINCKFIKYNDKKKNAILTTCISGMGTAVKLKELISECIDDSGIEVIAYDFNKLKNNKIKDEIFKEYNVLLVVGTSNVGIKEVPYMSVEEIITRKGEMLLLKVLEDKLSETTVEEINKNIVKKFSLENIINRLTILNPSKIIDQVERAISEIEIGVNRKFDNNLKVSLLIHISCLIERIIVRDYIDVMNGYEEFEIQNKEFIRLIRDAFKEISTMYKVEIPIGEIQIIHQVINNF